MTAQYRTFFGLSREPFGSDLSLKEILKTPTLSAVQDRFDYTVRLGGIALVTGDIGSGKSTALRYVAASLHPSEYKILPLTATPGSILDPLPSPPGRSPYRKIQHFPGRPDPSHPTRNPLPL